MLFDTKGHNFERDIIMLNVRESAGRKIFQLLFIEGVSLSHHVTYSP